MTDKFEQKMEQLNIQYEQIPTHSSSSSIMNHIKKQERKRKWLKPVVPKQLQVAALIILTIGIGYILGISGSMNELSQNSASEEQATTETGDSNLYQSGSEEMHSNRIAEEDDESTSIMEGAPTEEGDESASIMEAVPTEEAIEASSKTIITRNSEGESVEKEVTSLETKFNFRTYYDSSFTSEHYANDEMESYKIFPIFNEQQMAEVVFEITKLNIADANQQIDRYQEILREEGFTIIDQSVEKGYFFGTESEVITEFMAEKGEINTHISQIARGEDIYFIRTDRLADSETIERLDYEFNFIIENNEWF
ncbi:hypothetical protein [Bacillus suaedae]|uniref:Uncharacterized protein n=1 Tax=Halalkalibacter suaedae TaxID=2822140 RepID=A0A941AMD6_9BACI|nr:hypothetical protein [Bacillus suaedae]MBP3950395.1 hypothetical protein [Bacillus suaedae]